MSKRERKKIINPEEVFKGEYDKNNAVVSIFAGAGGTDAQDWAEMLMRMYLRYGQKQEWKTSVLQVKEGKDAGIKSASICLEGQYAYGYLKKEAGVHRLVRLSPFNANNLRQTSFALVDVLPEIAESQEAAIRPEDLKIDTYKAGGAGGQYVNKTESAIRITHLPTGISAACQSERSQGENRRKAMQILSSKLYQLKQSNQEQELRRLRGETMPNEWGSQIRSYVLHPYKMVKDHRTDVKSSQPEKVLDGDLDKFILAQIKS